MSHFGESVENATGGCDVKEGGGGMDNTEEETTKERVRCVNSANRGQNWREWSENGKKWHKTGLKRIKWQKNGTKGTKWNKMEQQEDK